MSENVATSTNKLRRAKCVVCDETLEAPNERLAHRVFEDHLIKSDKFDIVKGPKCVYRICCTLCDDASLDMPPGSWRSAVVRQIFFQHSRSCKRILRHPHKRAADESTTQHSHSKRRLDDQVPTILIDDSIPSETFSFLRSLGSPEPSEQNVDDTSSPVAAAIESLSTIENGDHVTAMDHEGSSGTISRSSSASTTPPAADPAELQESHFQLTAAELQRSQFVGTHISPSSAGTALNGYLAPPYGRPVALQQRIEDEGFRRRYNSMPNRILRSPMTMSGSQYAEPSSWDENLQYSWQQSYGRWLARMDDITRVMRPDSAMRVLDTHTNQMNTDLAERAFETESYGGLPTTHQERSEGKYHQPDLVTVSNSFVRTLPFREQEKDGEVISQIALRRVAQWYQDAQHLTSTKNFAAASRLHDDTLRLLSQIWRMTTSREIQRNVDDTRKVIETCKSQLMQKGGVSGLQSDNEIPDEGIATVASQQQRIDRAGKPAGSQETFSTADLFSPLAITSESFFTTKPLYERNAITKFIYLIDGLYKRAGILCPFQDALDLGRLALQSKFDFERLFGTHEKTIYAPSEAERYLTCRYSIVFRKEAVKYCDEKWFMPKLFHTEAKVFGFTDDTAVWVCCLTIRWIILVSDNGLSATKAHMEILGFMLTRLTSSFRSYNGNDADKTSSSEAALHFGMLIGAVFKYLITKESDKVDSAWKALKNIIFQLLEYTKQSQSRPQHEIASAACDVFHALILMAPELYTMTTTNHGESSSLKQPGPIVTTKPFIDRLLLHLSSISTRDQSKCIILGDHLRKITTTISHITQQCQSDESEDEIPQLIFDE